VTSNQNCTILKPDSGNTVLFADKNPEKIKDYKRPQKERHYSKTSITE
jgi:hypothetical protein